MHTNTLHPLLRYVLSACVLLLSSAYVHATTTITSLTANPTTAAPGQAVSFTITGQTTASRLSGDAILILSRDGTPIFQTTESGFLDAQDIGDGNLSDTFSLPPELYSTPGSYALEVQLSGTEDGEIPFSDSATTTFAVQESVISPITVQPSSLSLQGEAGESPTASFSILSGTPLFSLTSANAEGRGSFSNDNPGLNEAVIYSFRIPGSATESQQFTDTITVIGADGATTTVLATITVEGSGGGGPSQSDIDEAMQSIANTPPQRATALAISTLCPAGVAEPRLQQDCNVVVGASFTNTTQGSLALGQVTTDQASAPVDASQTTVAGQIQNVSTRISALRSGITGFSARGLTVSLDGQSLPVGQVAEELVGSLAGATGGAAGDTTLNFGRWGVFVNGSLSSGDKDRTENEDGFNFDAWSVTLGADYRFSDNLVGGAALGYAKNETDLDLNGGRLDTENWNLSLYGTYYLDSGLYLDGILTYGWNDYDQRRNIRYDIGTVSVNQSAMSDFDGSLWSASFGGGYAFSRGALSFGPTARLEYLKTDVDGFQERMSNPTADGGGWATRIGDQDVSSFNSQLGGEISYAVSTSWGVLLPNAHVEWVHEFEDGSDNIVGHFVQDTSRTQFVLPTDDLDRDYFNLRLGISAQFAEGRSGFIYYRKLFGYKDLNSDTIAAGLRLDF